MPLNDAPRYRDTSNRKQRTAAKQDKKSDVFAAHSNMWEFPVATQQGVTDMWEFPVATQQGVTDMRRFPVATQQGVTDMLGISYSNPARGYRHVGDFL